MDDRDVRIVEKYIDKRLFKPTSSYDIESFEIASYSRWAAYEILNRVLEETFKPPPCVGEDTAIDLIEIIERFAFDMEQCVIISTDERIKRMFEIAENTADDILYFYIKERGSEQ